MFQHEPEVFIISESRCTEDIEDVETHVDGYVTIRCDSRSRHTGGVIVFIKNKLKCSTGNQYIMEANYWIQFVKVNIYGTDWNIGGLYHSPSGSYSAFLDKLKEVFEDCCYGNNFLIVSDFNLDFKGNNFYTEKLKNILEIFGILQNVGDYTRITDCSKTLIDYALSKKPMTVAVYHVPRIADHSIIGVKLKENLSKKSSKKKIYTRRLDDDAFLGINDMLLDCQWKSTSCDIDEIFENLYENCKTVLDNNFPVILKEYDKNSLPWYDKDLKNKAKERDIAYKKYINAVENRAELWEEYKSSLIGIKIIAKKCGCV